MSTRGQLREIQDAIDRHRVLDAIRAQPEAGTWTMIEGAANEIGMPVSTLRRRFIDGKLFGVRQPAGSWDALLQLIK